MALVQINNKNIVNTLIALPIIGIDFGTTNSVACLVEVNAGGTTGAKRFAKFGKPNIDGIDGEDEMLPSAVAVMKNGNMVVGHHALVLEGVDGVVVVKSVKRLFNFDKDNIIESGIFEKDIYFLLSDCCPIKPLPKGASFAFNKATGLAGFIIFGKFYSCVEIAMPIAQELIFASLEMLDGKPEGVEDAVLPIILCVPAYFSSYAKQLTQNIFGSIKNVCVKRIINEPTSASMAYGISNNMNGTFMVYDLGGGTFDVSVLQVVNGVFNVLATAGDPNFGGDNMDEAVLREIVKKAIFVDLNSAYINLAMAKAVRHALSEVDICLLQFSLPRDAKNDSELMWEVCRFGGSSISVASVLGSGFCNYSSSSNTTKEMVMVKAIAITRGEFEDAVRKMLQNTISITKKAISVAEVDTNDTKVILVGGVTRTPLVREMIKSNVSTNLCQLSNSIHIDMAVAVGAGIQGAILDGRLRPSLLLDVVPLSIGIETFGGGVDFIIQRNTPFPASASTSLTTAVSGQTSIAFTIVEGERAIAKCCRVIGKFIAPLSVVALAGLANVTLNLTVDIDGLLTITVTGDVKEKIVIEANALHGINLGYIKNVLKDSIKHAKDDIMEVKRIQAINSANMAIIHADNIINFLLGNGLSADNVDVCAAKDAIANLQAAINGESVLKVRKANIDLEVIMEPLVAKYLQLTVNTDRDIISIK